MFNMSTEDKLKHETPHFGNTLLGAVLLIKLDKMTETEFNQKVEKINEIMEKHELSALDDYYTDMYMTQNHDFLFRVKHQRFYESQKEAEDVLSEILNQLLKFDCSAVL